MSRSFTQAVLEALALPPAIAESTLIATGWQGTPGGVTWSCAYEQPSFAIVRASQREAIATQMAIAWSVSDDNPHADRIRRMTDSLVAETRFQCVRALLDALSRPPCSACHGTGSTLCATCGHSGEDKRRIAAWNDIYQRRREARSRA